MKQHLAADPWGPSLAWAQHEFGAANLGDKRREDRLVNLAARMAQSPMQSIPAACKGLAETTAAYRFFSQDTSTVEAIIQPHSKATIERVKAHQFVLCVQDTTEADYTKKTQLQGSGPLSDKNRRGFFAHNHLVFTPQGVPLGMLGTKIFNRKDAEHGKAKLRKQKPIEQKESYRWVEAYLEACELADQAPQTQVVSCSDREGDIYEMFSQHKQRMEQGLSVAGLLIRCHHDRVVDKDAQGNMNLKKKVRSTDILGTVEVEIQQTQRMQKVKGGKGTRKKVTRSQRTAQLEIRATTVKPRVPYRKNTTLPSVEFQVVMATEKNPPENEEPIEWVLLTTLPVTTAQEAFRIIELYLVRWEIEVYHRILKSGCKIEDLQLKDKARLEPAIALNMVIAWRVMYITKMGRTCPDLPCDVVFEEDEWQSMWIIHKKEQPPKQKPTLEECVRILAMLGGFLGRKHDGHPGAQTIWRGLERLRDLSMAWKVFQNTQPEPEDNSLPQEMAH